MNVTKLIFRLDRAGVLGYSPGEIQFVYETMRERRFDFVCEWGTNVGHSARMFHEARVLLKLDCQLHSVDSVDQVPILRGADAGRKRGAMVKRKPVRLHVGDGAWTALGLYRSSGCTRPLLFLDDNHEEEEVLRQLELLGPKLPEATILLHDAYGHGPERAVRKYLDAHGGFTVDGTYAGQTMMRMTPE